MHKKHCAPRSFLATVGVFALLGTLAAQSLYCPVVPTEAYPGDYIAHSIFYTDPGALPPTSLSTDAQGRVYALFLDGTVKVLEDTNADKIADVITVFWNGTNISSPALGLLVFQGAVFVSHLATITRIVDLNNDLIGDTATDIVTGLPFGWHGNNNLFTDGTSIYFGLGTQSDHDVDPDPRSGTLMRMNPDGTGLVIHATGLRNVYDGVVVPGTNEILVGDNGPNLVPGLPDPPDELNSVVQGGNYGHPLNWGVPPPGATTLAPLVAICSHLAPTGMAINPCTRFSGYRNEVWMSTFGGPFTSVSRFALTTNPANQARGSHWEILAAAGTVNLGTIPLSAAIDLIFGSAGEAYVADYSAHRILMLYPSHPSRIIIEGTGSIGTTCPITFADETHPLHLVVGAASSFALGPPLSVGGINHIDLDLGSPIFAFSLLAGNGYFNFPFLALLDAQGFIGSSIVVLNDPALIGLGLRLQYAVISPTTGLVVDVSPPQAFWIAP